MPSIELDGVGLYYEESGTGKTVIFCHGIPTDYRAWASQVGPFAKDRRVVSYSRRYAYPNKREGDVKDSTVENNATDLGALIEKVGSGPVDLIGHSYGGFTAALVAADHPDLVRSLVLVEPAIATLLVEDETSRGQMLSLLFRSPSVALSASRFQSRSLRPSLKALDAGQAQKAVELNVDGVEDKPGTFASMPEAQRQMMLDNVKTIGELRTKLPPSRARIGKIACRTLVINGEDSALWLRRIGELTAAAIPHAQGTKIPKSRHFPHIENPSEFNQRVLAFLSAGS